MGKNLRNSLIDSLIVGVLFFLLIDSKNIINNLFVSFLFATMFGIISYFWKFILEIRDLKGKKGEGK